MDKKNIKIKNLSLRLGEFHLRKINLEINTGEYFVLLGPTGSGKTILLEAIAGLQTPQEGEILINRQDFTQIPPESRGIGFVYQDYALFPHLTVRENIAFGWKARNRSQVQRLLPFFNIREKKSTEALITAQVDEISRLLNIENLLHRTPKTLSGGEQQRVALARALIIKPRLLLLDEPLSALDPERREELQYELQRIHKEVGTTTIHVTHDFEEAVALGDRIAILHEGQILQVGSPEDVFRRPASKFIARFVGVRNIFQTEIIKSASNGTKLLALNGLTITALSSLAEPAHFSIRPEDIILSREKLTSSIRNSFQGKITMIANRGTLIYITLEVSTSQKQKPPIPFIVAITHRSLEELDLRINDKINLSFKASAVHVF